MEVGDPEEDLHDPDNLMQIVEGGVDNEDAHIKVIDGNRGPRMMCKPSGNLTSIVEESPNGEGQGEDTKEEETQAAKQPSEPIYDLQEEKSPMDVLAEVVTSPFINLNEDQINEIRDWAEDYNGQIPPDILEDILGNMSGVQKQTAALARQKYEVKLNRWVRDQTQGSDGPPIGISAQPPAPARGRSSGRQPGGSPPSQQGETEPDGQSSTNRRGGNGTGPTSVGDIRDYRQVRRVDRRNDALDTFTKETAHQLAEQMSGELIGNFARYFGLPAKVLEAKAEKDPDWFLEKLEQWDIDIDEFLEPSEARKEELRQDKGPPEADREVDQALTETTSQREEPKVEEEIGSEVFDEDFEDEEPIMLDESGEQLDDQDDDPFIPIQESD